jgi:hypothetical protein
MPKRDDPHAAADLLTATLTGVVEEMIESKCAKLTARERATLRRRITKAVELFVEGMQLTPAQRRAEAKRSVS